MSAIGFCLAAFFLGLLIGDRTYLVVGSKTIFFLGGIMGFFVTKWVQLIYTGFMEPYASERNLDTD